MLPRIHTGVPLGIPRCLHTATVNTLEHIPFREYDKRERRSAWYSRCIGMPLYVPHTQTHTQTHTERHRDTTQNAQEKHAHACLSLALERELQQGG